MFLLTLLVAASVAPPRLPSPPSAAPTVLFVAASAGLAAAPAGIASSPGTAVPPLLPLRVVHPFTAVGRYAAGDRGVDLAGTPGQVVRSATAGTVSFAGAVAGAGVLSVRLADGRLLTYEPVRPEVRAGTVVAPGQPLGVLAGGHLGCPAVACLHWGLRLADRTYADPLALLRPVAIRLLPPYGVAPGAVPAQQVWTGAGGRPHAPRAGGSGSASAAGAAAVGSVLVAGSGLTAVGIMSARRRRSGRPARPGLGS